MPLIQHVALQDIPPRLLPQNDEVDVEVRQYRQHVKGPRSRERSHPAAIVCKGDYATCRFAGLSERMMGLEPTTFCMANARDVRARSLPFAQTARLQRLHPSERTRPNQSERPALPFLPRIVRRGVKRFCTPFGWYTANTRNRFFPRSCLVDIDRISERANGRMVERAKRDQRERGDADYKVELAEGSPSRRQERNCACRGTLSQR
jgi:hypothetical protein